MPADPQIQQTLVRIGLSDELLNHFEAQAVLADTSLEQAIADHLGATFEQSGNHHAIYLDDGQAAECRRLLGGRVNGGSKLIEMIQRLCSWRVGGYKIELSPALQEQIAAYAHALNRTVEQAAPELIITAIREKFRT